MKKIFFLINVLLIAYFAEAQIGIGTTTPNASAKLDVSSTNKGFLPPRMTYAQRTAISSPAEGLMVYQTDGTSGLYYYGSSGWIYIINSTTNVVSVVNGGTGTTTATGTGSVVLNTSPTLITPALGTPSSATLTNASGLPIASGVSGLGTGVASFLATPTSSNLVSAISDETGSGALVFGTSPNLTTPTLGVASGTSLALTGTTVSNSTSTGALTVAGGAGIGGALNASSVTATNFVGSGSQLTDVATRVTGSWTLNTGANDVSFTVTGGGTYSMWVNGNIPNGIALWIATVTTANTNVPVLGSQYAWYYSDGNALVWNNIPNQITGTNNTIVSSPVSYTPNTSNVFKFRITNNSGAQQTIYYGYIKLL
jgi:hypothetical protein